MWVGWMELFSQPPLPILGLVPESQHGAGQGQPGWGPSLALPVSPEGADTRSLGIYHAPNYNVNWQVPEIN